MMTAAETPVATATATILLVEDDPQIARLERFQLERSGYAVVVAGTRDTLFTQLRGGAADLMVLDIGLADGVNGLDLYTEVRAAGFDVPAVLVTGRHNDELLIRALRAGVRDVLPKSPSFAELLPDVIGRVLAQVRTEKRLVESEARLASVIGSALDAILVAGTDWRVSLMNPAAERMFRCLAEDGIGRPLDDFLPDGFRSSSENGDPTGTPLPQRLRNPVLARRSDGERFPVEVSFSRADANGRPFFTAVVRDVTERERTAAKIREQAALLDQTNEAIVVRDPNGRVVYWNRGAARMYGGTATEAAAGTVSDTLTAEAFRKLARARRELSETGQWSGELRHVRKDGREVIVASRWSLLRGLDRQETGTLVIDSDVTAQKQLENQFLHAQKMQAVGQLAGGVAHDFNNLLTVVLGTAELVLMRNDLDAEVREAVTTIRHAGDRGAGLIRQLLAFSRRDPLPAQVVDMNAVVRDAERMLPRLIGDHITVTTTLGADLGLISANPGQLEQVIVNLAVNARDAMPAGGALSIETRDAVLPTGTRSGGYVLLAVTDTGHGMTEETRARIFEPFFTTKEVGAGTGLGLATVYAIVQQAGGLVEVESAVGQDSRFSVYLPRHEGDQVIDPAPLPSARGGTESVLVVEDDLKIRTTLKLALQNLGYKVTVTSDAEGALAILSETANTIDLLATEIVAPKMSGIELAGRVSASFPRIRVLFLSDGTSESALGNGLTHPGAEVLHKPFTHSELGDAVRRALGSGEPSAQPS